MKKRVHAGGAINRKTRQACGIGCLSGSDTGHKSLKPVDLAERGDLMNDNVEACDLAKKGNDRRQREYTERTADKAFRQTK